MPLPDTQGARRDPATQTCAFADPSFEERWLLDEVLWSVDRPLGWRLLRVSGRLEARWRSASGSWAALSVRVQEREQEQHPPTGLCLRFPLGEHHLEFSFRSSDASPETLRATARLLAVLPAAPSCGSVDELGFREG